MREIVLVTGGSGFVAGWCIVELLKRGYEVRTTLRDLSKEMTVRKSIAATAGSTDRLAFYAADLTKDEGWDAAAENCDYILHVASPLGGVSSRDPDAWIAPACDGTIRVLNAAIKARVKRIVMTSAAAAARPRFDSNEISNETIWADPTEPRFDAYRRSKILAERAAWDFMAKNRRSNLLTTILPSAVFGPVLAQENLGSVQIIQRLLSGRPRGIPRLGFYVVDVRDLADLHIRAMTNPKAAGQRFIAAGEFMWMKDIAQTLKSTMGEQASKVPTRILPNFVVRFLSLFIVQLRMLKSELGRKNSLTSEKARRLLGFSTRPAVATIRDCATSLLNVKTDK